MSAPTKVWVSGGWNIVVLKIFMLANPFSRYETILDPRFGHGVAVGEGLLRLFTQASSRRSSSTAQHVLCGLLNDIRK